MDITPEQRTYAKVAGIAYLAKIVAELFGDSVTIIARSGETFTEIARVATQAEALWRFCLLSVVLAWLMTGVLAYALYVVLEPVNKRLAQLAFVLRLGSSLVGAASVMFRIAQARIFKATETDVFTTEQLRTLSSVVQRGSGEGVETAWMLMCSGSAIFFLLFLRSRYLPRPVAILGIGASVLLGVASAVMFVFPQRINELKLLGLPMLLAELITSFWLLFKFRPRAAGEER